MKLFEAILNVIILSVIYATLEALAIKYGYTGNFASADASLIFDGLIIAGTLMSHD